MSEKPGTKELLCAFKAFCDATAVLAEMAYLDDELWNATLGSGRFYPEVLGSFHEFADDVSYWQESVDE